ncbi:hypothetical protein [Flavobacterium sp. 5]|uniref:hypothetical protein n=1 Tax=Flavobacterium sp. 5 TaxID=2035199 RepID=UPI000C2B6EF0|nr:hypothetical protein [Flavobacterium sp. 5]PKB16700.1 hypothetical protein CLU82_1845 [Flavobacterium sp. 5]
MNQSEFHEAFETHSRNAFEELILCSEEELWQIILIKNNKRYDVWKGSENYQIWRVINVKGTAKSIKPLFDIVSNLKNEYLVRYHACDALFKLAGINDAEFKGKIQYGLNSNRKKVNQITEIEKLRNVLQITKNTEKKAWWKIW